MARLHGNHYCLLHRRFNYDWRHPAHPPLHNDDDPGPKEELSITIDSEESLTDGKIPDGATTKGTVNGLQEGSVLWVFNRPVGSDDYFPASAPCPIKNDEDWTCKDVQIGESGAAGKGSYNIIAAAIDSDQITRIVENAVCYKYQEVQGLSRRVSSFPQERLAL